MIIIKGQSDVSAEPSKAFKGFHNPSWAEPM